MDTVREISDVEVDMVTGALAWYYRVAISAAYGPLGGVALGIYDGVKLGWDSAHGRALNADS